MTFPALETAPQIDALLAAGASVAIGVSGGKDSDVAAAETLAYLKQVGHMGPRILIHSDLGRIEWKDSLPACERLARRYDLELVVVKRQDIAPHLLSEEALLRLREAKRRASLREQVETRIPKHLLYTKGWPRMMPTPSEARLLSDVRKSVAEMMELSIHYTEPEAIEHRYAELMAINALRGKTQPALPEPLQQGLWTMEGVAS